MFGNTLSAQGVEAEKVIYFLMSALFPEALTVFK